jgi:hypothetical protein
VRIAIVGFPQTGKTSLFRVLCGPHVHPDAYGVHVGIAHLPDPRLEALSKRVQPKKTTYASLQFLDAPALLNEPEKDTGLFGQIRGADGFAHVVRLFGEEVNPAEDVIRLETEFLVVDLDTVSRRLTKIEHDLKKTKTPELELEHGVLTKAGSALAAEQPLRALDWAAEERKVLQGFMLLSTKPLLVVANARESEAPRLDQLANKYGLAELGQRAGVALTEICGQIEAELMELEPSEAAEFLASYGLRESARDHVLQTLRRLLGLMSFFTVSEPECRAWLAPRGTVAVEAAGMVHSDFARAFIKAEVIPWKELVETGSLAAAREQGRVRLEGKQHEIHDGDVLYIRHGG